MTKKSDLSRCPRCGMAYDCQYQGVCRYLCGTELFLADGKILLQGSACRLIQRLRRALSKSLAAGMPREKP